LVLEVYGSGFRVSGFGVRVQGSEFRVMGFHESRAVLALLRLPLRTQGVPTPLFWNVRPTHLFEVGCVWGL